MGRKIKFRAWHKTHQQWIENFMSTSMLADLDTILNYIGDIEIMEWTGLLDRAGNLIYEGDIVKATIEPKEDTHYGEDFERGYWIGEVIYRDCGFHIKQADDKYMPTLTNYCIKSLGVIGNIYEAPRQGEQVSE